MRKIEKLTNKALLLPTLEEAYKAVEMPTYDLLRSIGLSPRAASDATSQVLEELRETYTQA